MLQADSELERNFAALALYMNQRDGRWYCDYEDDDVVTTRASRHILHRLIRIGLVEPFEDVPDVLYLTEKGYRWAILYRARLQTDLLPKEQELFFCVQPGRFGSSKESRWRRLMKFLDVPQIGRGLWATHRDLSDLFPLLDDNIIIIKGSRLSTFLPGSQMHESHAFVNQPKISNPQAPS